MAFSFDASIYVGDEDRFAVSGDGKTAVFRGSRRGHVLLGPSISEGIHSLKLRIGAMPRYITIGVANSRSKVVTDCAAFSNEGDVRVNGESITFDYSIAWRNGDCVTLIADLGRRTLTIQAPNGKFTTNIPSQNTRLWFGVFAVGTGTRLSVVNIPRAVAVPPRREVQKAAVRVPEVVVVPPPKAVVAPPKAVVELPKVVVKPRKVFVEPPKVVVESPEVIAARMRIRAEVERNREAVSTGRVSCCEPRPRREGEIRWTDWPVWVTCFTCVVIPGLMIALIAGAF